MLGSNDIEAWRWGNQQQIDGSQVRALAFFFGNELQGLVDALHPLHIDSQRIQKNTGQGVTRNVRQ